MTEDKNNFQKRKMMCGGGALDAVYGLGFVGSLTLFHKIGII